ncbi:DUF1097 domain-containing protein [Clostridium sp. D5]|uniref:DUF1097 domain-containing protein n=1 Tax=Clostridium sp. D5 TaxID=556261 RepID=UPI00325BFA0D
MGVENVEEKKLKRINMLTLAFGIALLPPIWAVLSPYMGVSVGAVALICAGLYVANGNNRSNAPKITIGFLLGDVWAFFAVWIMETLQGNPNVELYFTLFVLGGLAVLIGETFSKIIFVPSWLCGWAIGLTIMGPMQVAEIGTLPIQIGAAMIAGVVYVGIGVDALQKFLVRCLMKEEKPVKKLIKNI